MAIRKTGVDPLANHVAPESQEAYGSGAAFEPTSYREPGEVSIRPGILRHDHKDRCCIAGKMDGNQLMPLVNEGMSKKNSRQDSPRLRTAGAESTRHSPVMTASSRPTEELLRELQARQTELKRLNETLHQTRLALEESRDRYVDLYDFAPVGLLTLTPKAIIAEINFTAAELLGEERQKLLNCRFERFIAPEGNGQWRRHFLETLEKDGTHHCELALRRGDGSRLHIGLGCLCLKTGNEPKVVRVAFADITERKQAEEALRNSENKFSILFSKASLPAVLSRFPDHVFVDVNDAWAQLFGYTKEELIGKTSWELGISRDAEHRTGRSDEARRCNSVRNFEQTLFSKAGDALTVLTNANVVTIDRQDYAITTVQDITERKQIETELKEHQQLLRELAAKDVKLREAEYKHIAREVHDELGQLLTALRMDISLLRIQFGKRDPVLMKKVKDILMLADKAINGVRNVAVNLRPAALDMGVVPAIVWLCDKFPNRMDTACTLRVVTNPAGLDDARTAAIFRIVQESLTNVARHAAANSVEITIGKDGDNVAVEVCDDGRGFDPAATPTKKSFGLLGMSERALAVGGKVEITSAPSKGTVVSVRIPIKPGEHIL